MIVRGAPAIGATAAFGIVIGAKEVGVIEDKKRWLEELKKIGFELKQTRPTAVNLAWAVERMLKKAEDNIQSGIPQLQDILENEALEIAREMLKVIML